MLKEYNPTTVKGEGRILTKDINRNFRLIANALKAVKEEFLASRRRTVGGGRGGSSTTVVTSKKKDHGRLYSGDYDDIELTETSGKISQIVYKLATAVVATIAVSYNSSGRPSTMVMAGGKTKTVTYAGTGFPTSIVRA